jgi:hypothetical protein
MNPYRQIDPQCTPRRATTLAGLLAVTALGLGACASVPPPTEQMAVSSAALNHAVGADAGALAPAEMSLARDKMARAEQAVAAKEYERALVLAQQAQLDAQLAEAKAETVKSRRAADALVDASRALREEMSRQTPITAPRN